MSGVLRAKAIQSKTQHEHTPLNKTHYQFVVSIFQVENTTKI